MYTIWLGHMWHRSYWRRGTENRVMKQAAGLSCCSNQSTTVRSPGIISCVRPAIGKEPYGESPSGQIDLIMTGQPGEPGPASSQVPRMNTTIPGSIYLRSQQQASGEDLFLTCYVNTLWIRSERHLRGAGTVTITHGSLWTVDGFKR